MRAGARHTRSLAAAFVLTATFFVVEVVAGFATNSLALLSDAGHMLTDVLGLGLALGAIHAATRFGRRGSDHGESRLTFGLYRLEILAALLNALILFAVALFVLVEAFRRIGADTEVDSGPMLVVASLGLLVNLVAFVLLRRGARESINVEGAYLEVLADMVGSIGVIVAAVALEAFGLRWVDPVVAALIGIWILPRTARLGRQAIRVLLQSAPQHVDLVALRTDLGALPGVIDVHDLHVWTLTSEMEAVSAHLMVGDGVDQHAVLDQARHLVAGRYGIEHGTFQVEPHTHAGCGDVDW